MSRVGNRPVGIPDKVEASLEGRGIRVKGPLGELRREIPGGISVAVDAGERKIEVTRANDEKEQRALHGLMRSLIHNMVHGVSAGYDKKLQIVGVGYSARLQGSDLSMQIGFSHPVVLRIPEGLSVETPSATEILVKGVDKQQVGQFAADVRRVRPPEPYNGKGIRYDGENVRRKAGKAFVGGQD